MIPKQTLKYSLFSGMLCCKIEIELVGAPASSCGSLRNLRVGFSLESAPFGKNPPSKERD
jgi:hypothetical protein